MNFLNYNPYGFMTFPQSNPVPMRQPQPVPQIQPPQMTQIEQMPSAEELLNGVMQANKKGGLKDQLRGQLGAAVGTFVGAQLGMPQVGAAIGGRIASGQRSEMPGLLQAPQLSNPMSFSFENAPQVADGSAQYVQMLRGLLA